MEHEKLFSSFPPVTVEQWEEKIKQDLKGADYSKKLIRRTLDNISIKPYYTAEDLKNLTCHVRVNKTCFNQWDIRQDFKVTDVDTAVEKAYHAFTRGVTSVGFDLTGKGDLYYHDFRKLLTGLNGSHIPVNLITDDTAPQILDFLIKALDELGIKRTEFKGAIEFDPLGNLASTGGFYYTADDDLKSAAEIASRAKDEVPALKVLAINSHIFSDAGATVIQELAFGLSMISDYLVSLTNKGLSVADIVGRMQWNLGAGSDYFMEIARIRAARMLVSALVSAFDDEAKDAPIYIHSQTTTWNKTLYDPHVNMLRLTTEAMAAILGGCDSLLVLPFDAVYNEPTDFSERLARNIQIILKEESYFDKVVDPAAGSYYIESLTDSLIHHAWDLFLKIDEQGGYVKSFLSGFIGGEVERVARLRMEMVASRRESLLGTNQYPNVNETINGCINEEIAYPQPFVN